LQTAVIISHVGSEEEAAKLAEAAETASKDRLTRPQQETTTATISTTPSASSSSSRGGATATTGRSGGRSAQASGSPQKPPTGLKSRKQGRGQASKQQDGTASVAAVELPRDGGEDDLPAPMTWKVSQA